MFYFFFMLLQLDLLPNRRLLPRICDGNTTSKRYRECFCIWQLHVFVIIIQIQWQLPEVLVLLTPFSGSLAKVINK